MDWIERYTILYDELMALVADLRRELAEAAAASALPAEPDAAAVEGVGGGFAAAGVGGCAVHSTRPNSRSSQEIGTT